MLCSLNSAAPALNAAMMIDDSAPAFTQQKADLTVTRFTPLLSYNSHASLGRFITTS